MMPSSTQAFSGDRLRLARVFGGLSQSELGARVEVTHASISQAENGVRQPSDTIVEKMAQVLGFDVSFFYAPAPTEFRDDECYFRRRKTTPMGVRNKVLASGTLFNELVGLLDASVRLPPYDVPSIRVKTVEDIETAAERVREHWKLRLDTPIKNVTRVLERAGIVIARFAASAGKIDAFSRAGDRGVIVLNTDKGSTSRSRHDKGHECGHLVMHGGLDHGSYEEEAQADRFASAFLMPRAAFSREFPRPGAGRVRLEALIPMKMRWQSSIAAIVRRAYDLRLISPAQYQAAFKQYYSRGMHRGETAEPPDEVPEIVSLAFKVLEDQGVTREDVVRRLGWTDEVLAKIAPDLAPPTITGPTNVIPFAQVKTRRPVRPPE
ncbi:MULTISPECIES: helix-turn-helix domain-containing protein [unclassified Anaeromyxobacter]|uniref:helix-turn-helix domain-containing protein n=1 Tax=unclassified Anaeromyxobacter TaxID=2620896 RepID=UPI001F59C445|nr:MULTISPECIES: XRE family transcriptional regulator [unclassified Anaeromyxobacter]